MRINDWFDDNVFSDAQGEGWKNALGYYAARDPVMDSVRELWFECNQRWLDQRPEEVPSFEVWRRMAK